MERLYIISPVSNRPIFVDGPTYTGLLEEGYILNRLPRYTRDQLKKRSGAKVSGSPKKSGDKGVLSEHGYSTKTSSFERHHAILSSVLEHGPNIPAEHLKIRADQNSERNPGVSAIMFGDLVWLEKEIAQNIDEEEAAPAAGGGAGAAAAAAASSAVVRPLRSPIRPKKRSK